MSILVLMCSTGTMSSPPDNTIATAIAAMAQEIADIAPAETMDVLSAATKTSLSLIPEINCAGITVIDGKRRVRTATTTGWLPARLDQLQNTLGQGPCMETIGEHHTVRVTDFTTEKRWPAFVETLLDETSLRSSLSIQLAIDNDKISALNLWSERPAVFTPEIEDMAMALATHAAVGIVWMRRDQELRSALATRDIIGQAKGILMERFTIDAMASFRMLVALSQDRNEKVSEIARRVVEENLRVQR